MLNFWRGIAKFLQPITHARATPAGVNHQVGSHYFGALPSLAIDHTHTTDLQAALVCYQTQHIALFKQANIGHGKHAGAHLCFQQRPAYIQATRPPLHRMKVATPREEATKTAQRAPRNQVL
jgi:hypothetical protein